MKFGGVLLVCKNTGRFLLGERSELGTYPNTWSLFGGTIEPDEEVLDGVIREVFEETKIDISNNDFKLFEVQYYTGYPYYFFISYCDEEYECELNEENTDFGWFSMGDLPYPLFPTLYSSLVRIFGV